MGRAPARSAVVTHTVGETISPNPSASAKCHSLAVLELDTRLLKDILPDPFNFDNGG